jgi:hypothetical protein
VHVDDAERRMRKRDHEGRFRSQHAVHLSEDAVEVGDRRQRVDAQRDVDRVRADEREVGEVAVAQLDLRLFALDEAARVADLFVGIVHRDHARALFRHRDGIGTTAAAELEDALVLELAEEA